MGKAFRSDARAAPPLQTVDRRPWTADRGPQKGARIQGEGR